MARHTMTNYEAAADVIIMMGVAGYQISQVQKEKIEDKKPDLSNTPPAPPDPTPTPPVQ